MAGLTPQTAQAAATALDCIKLRRENVVFIEPVFLLLVQSTVCRACRQRLRNSMPAARESHCDSLRLSFAEAVDQSRGKAAAGLHGGTKAGEEVFGHQLECD